MKKVCIVVVSTIIIALFSVITINVIFKESVKLNVSGVLDNYSYNISSEEYIKVEYNNFSNIKSSIPIFMYHWIKDDTGDYPYPENMVKPEELRKQFEYLSTNNYDTIFVTDIESIQHYDKPIILTFDDGWMDVYNHAFPLAKEYNIKFCMYIISDFVGEPGYCTLDQLIEMRDSGIVQIDTHTKTHPKLAELSISEIAFEIGTCRDYIKDNLDIESSVICYPYGSCNNDVVSESSKLFDYGLLMDGGVFKYTYGKSDLYRIERIYAMRSMTLDTFVNYCKNASVSI